MDNEILNSNTHPQAWVKSLKIAAIISFIVGFLLLLFFVWDYSRLICPKEFSFYFDHQDGIQDLATVLLGSTGLMWSLTATFLFIYTIFQTRVQIAMQQTEIRNQVKEMKTSNETSKNQYNLALSQQYRNTFFNLLENHNKLLETIHYAGEQGMSAVNTMHDHIRNSCDRYEVCVWTQEFESFEKTEEFPKYKYFVAAYSIDSLLKNFCTTVKFIDDFLKDEKQLYYEILDNNLSVAEKYLINYYCTFYDGEQTKFLIEHPYSFRDFDETKTYELKIDSYFPTVMIQFNKAPIKYQNFQNSSITYFNCVLQNAYDEFQGALTLVKIVLSVLKAGGNVVYGAELGVNSIIKPRTDYLCDAPNNLAKGYLKTLTQINEDILFSFIFVFDYAGTRYTIKNEHKFTAYGNAYNFSFTEQR